MRGDAPDATTIGGGAGDSGQIEAPRHHDLERRGRADAPSNAGHPGADRDRGVAGGPAASRDFVVQYVWLYYVVCRDEAIRRASRSRCGTTS